MDVEQTEAKPAKVYPRISVRLTDEVKEAVEKLAEITPASSTSEIVKRAIKTYHTLVKAQQAGNMPYVEAKTEDGVKKLPIFL